MPQDLTSFQKDLVTPGSGTNSELYRAIAPLIDFDRLPEPKNNFDQERLEKLKNDLRQGTLGLEYLTGLKQNKVETFFDSHPVQATVSNILGNGGRAGVGIAAGGSLINALRNWKNFSRTENAYDARQNDSAQSAGNRLSGVGKDGKPKAVLDDDVVRVFGSGAPSEVTATTATNGKRKVKGLANVSDLQRRMLSLDQVAGSKEKGRSFQNELDKLTKIKNPGKRTMAIKALMENTRSSKSYRVLKDYLDLSTDLQRMADSNKPLKGNFGSALGDKFFASDRVENILSKLPGGVQTAIRSIVPHSQKGFEDLVRKRIVKKYPNHVSEDMLKRIADDVYGTNLSAMAKGDMTQHIPLTAKDKVFNRAVFGPTGAIKNQGGFNRALRMFGGPAVMGAGVAGASLGLNELLKLIQSKVYGSDKIKEWKRNALKAKGEFEEAERIK